MAANHHAMSVVILVPVLRRPHRAQPLLDSIAAATPEPYRVLFIASPGDLEEHDAVRAAGGELLIIGDHPGHGDYAIKINAGYEHTTEPLLFLAADDLEFHPGWLENATRLLSDTVHIVGTNDLGNPDCIKGVHSTHTLVTRSYCDTHGTIDKRGTVLHEAYPHEYVDIEFVETAKVRGAWAHAGDSIVEHLHPNWGKADTDVLYDAQPARMAAGRKVWAQRKPKVQAEGRKIANRARIDRIRDKQAAKAARQERLQVSRSRLQASRSTPRPQAKATRAVRPAPVVAVTRPGQVTVITASLPDRSPQLRRAVASVAAQTVPAAHLIGVDAGRGVAELRNQLVAIADTEWVAFLDDDDHLDPHHLDTLLEHAGGYDVIVPHCRFAGDELPKPACCAGYYNRPYDRDDLRQHGIFPVTVLARRQAVLDAGGFALTGWDDWSLWNAMADAGARFTVVPEVTWTYDRRDFAGSRTALLQKTG